jgi:hypothetical protein
MKGSKKTRKAKPIQEKRPITKPGKRHPTIPVPAALER